MENNETMTERSPVRTDYRYERKFVLSGVTQHEVEAMVKFHPLIFIQNYPDRFINNFYFDTRGRKNYFDSIHGSNQRAKVRVRWYGDLLGTIQNPVLELKVKNGLAGMKKLLPLKAFSLGRDLKTPDLFRALRESDIAPPFKLDVLSFETTLLNRFQRKYYRSTDRRCRMTVDSGIQFYKPDSNSGFSLSQSTHLSDIILELKYPPREEGYIQEITSRFPFRLSKFSKYVYGIESLQV